MVKRKLSKKQATSSKKKLVSKTQKSAKKPKVKSAQQVIDILIKCIRKGDLKSFRDVLSDFIRSSNKSRLAKTTGLGRQTLYDILDLEKSFNPAFSTISAIIRGIEE